MAFRTTGPACVFFFGAAAARAPLPRPIAAHTELTLLPPPSPQPLPTQALIVEGPVPYPNGPPCWSNASQLGAYGFTALSQTGRADGECAPPVGGGAWAPPRGLRPISLRAHGEPLSTCLLACNVTEVAATGVDPCAAASIFDGGAVDPSLDGVRANYSCYFGGSSWLHPQGLGVCGFNCSAWQSDGAPCSEEDMEAGRCLVYCDSRALPGPGRAARGGVPAARGGGRGRAASVFKPQGY
jgi:hypothetical protein